MIDWTQFHFLRPYWLLALVPLILVIWLMLTRKLGNRTWENVCDATLLPYILLGERGRPRLISVVLTAACGLLAIVSLAGPAWNKLPQPVFSNRTALVIALDLSRSMNATDISPSRLARARFKLADILNTRKEGQTALVVYAGDAFTVTPLTDDTQTIISQLSALSPDLMPAPGNRADLALSLAEKLLKQGGMGRGDVLLITDDIDLSRSRARAESLATEGYRVSVMGVGTKQGVPIPLDDGSFLKDDSGKIIIPMLEEAPMRALAAGGGGLYVRLGIDDSDIRELARFFSVNANRTGAGKTELQTDVWREQGPWLLILLMPLAALVFRKGYLVILVFICLPFPNEARAFDWDSLWLRPDQRAQRVLKQGDAKKAAELFRDPAWKGAAQYQSGDYRAAVKSLENAEGVENLYNKGNALARAGRLKEAIAAYDQVLKLRPDHADAKYNKALLEQELKKQQQNQGQQKDQGQQQNQGQRQSGGKDNPRSGQQDKSGQDESGREQQGRDNAQTGQQTPGRREQDRAKNRKGGDQRERRQEEQKSQEAGTNDQRGNGPAGNNAVTSRDEVQPDEQEQATEQWLRRIPDDPAGLLRRKFLYQYKQRQSERDGEQKTW